MKLKQLNKLFHAAFAFCMLTGTTANIQAADLGRTTTASQSHQLAVPVVFAKDTQEPQAGTRQLSQPAKIQKYIQGTLLSRNLAGYSRVLVDEQEVYVKSDCLAITDEQKAALAKEKEREIEEKKKLEEAQKKVEQARQEAEKEAAQTRFDDSLEEEDLTLQVDQYAWTGSVLTPASGVNYGPSGKETYYNLPMEGVVSIMRSIGNQDEYWVREDGVKMLGAYVMVAAHLPTRPRGSLVPTSLGMGIVCDTGTFALNDHNQLDIAVAW